MDGKVPSLVGDGNQREDTRQANTIEKHSAAIERAGENFEDCRRGCIKGAGGTEKGGATREAGKVA